MIYKISKDDIRVSYNTQFMVLSAMVDRHYVERMYNGYPLTVAKKMFLDEVAQYTKPIAVKGTCNWGGIEIMDIINGIDDYVVSCEDYGSGRIRWSKARVNYSKGGRPYFNRHHQREYLDEYMRA